MFACSQARYRRHMSHQVVKGKPLYVGLAERKEAGEINLETEGQMHADPLQLGSLDKGSTRATSPTVSGRSHLVVLEQAQPILNGRVAGRTRHVKNGEVASCPCPVTVNCFEACLRM